MEVPRIRPTWSDSAKVATLSEKNSRKKYCLKKERKITFLFLCSVYISGSQLKLLRDQYIWKKFHNPQLIVFDLFGWIKPVKVEKKLVHDPFEIFHNRLRNAVSHQPFLWFTESFLSFEYSWPVKFRSMKKYND